MDDSSRPQDQPRHPGYDPLRADFATTRWSLVLAAQAPATSADAREALETLCATYWRPLYSYVRKRGYRPDDAEDLTQAFFAQLLERRDLAKVSPERGRLRAFLLTALKNFLANDWRRARAAKRGGDRLSFPLDFPAAEAQYAHQAAGDDPPERHFDREWALLLLRRARKTLQTRYEAEGKSRLFERLEPLLTGEAAPESYRQMAAELRMSEGAVKVAAHRLRQRFGAQLRAEIAQTLADPADVEAEIQDLFEVLRR